MVSGPGRAHGTVQSGRGDPRLWEGRWVDGRGPEGNVMNNKHQEVWCAGEEQEDEAATALNSCSTKERATNKPCHLSRLI